MASGRNIIRKLLQKLGFDVRRTLVRRVNDRRAFSKLGEREVIQGYLEKLNVNDGFFVDIGAGDGVRRSNVLELALRGWPGLCAEYNEEAFAGLAMLYRDFPGVTLCRGRVTPETVVPMLKAAGTPEAFSFLTLDIDGYDHYVLSALLTKFRPRLMCVEINEKFPPPVKFTVQYSSDYAWGHNFFMGQSLSKMCELTEAHDYVLAEVHYNNAFLMPEDICPVEAKSPEAAFRTGYVDKPDRKARFPWNAEVEDLLTMAPEDVVKRMHEMFKDYEGQYTCSL